MTSIPHPNYARGAIPPTPDPRDYPFNPRAAGAEPVTLPDVVDLRCGGAAPTQARPMGPVRDQGAEGSCTGQAVAELVEALHMVASGSFVRLSPRWVYWWERVMEGSTDRDAGADPRDGLSIALKGGVTTEAAWPYVAGNFTQQPGWLPDESAWDYRITQYQLCQGLQDVRQALALRRPVAATIPGGSYDFQVGTTQQRGIVPASALADRAYDHEPVVVGYTADWLLWQNSWGLGFGQQGYFYTPLDVFDTGWAIFPWVAWL